MPPHNQWMATRSAGICGRKPSGPACPKLRNAGSDANGILFHRRSIPVWPPPTTQGGRAEWGHSPPPRPWLSIGPRGPAMLRTDRLVLGEDRRVQGAASRKARRRLPRRRGLGHDGSPGRIISSSRGSSSPLRSVEARSAGHSSSGLLVGDLNQADDGERITEHAAPAGLSGGARVRRGDVIVWARTSVGVVEAESVAHEKPRNQARRPGQ